MDRAHNIDPSREKLEKPEIDAKSTKSSHKEVGGNRWIGTTDAAPIPPRVLTSLHASRFTCACRILTAHYEGIMIAAVRTTVTIDPDVERLVREAMHRTRKSFKETLNAAIRAGLSSRPKTATRKPFKVKARPMHLRPGLDAGSLNKLSDELEVDAFLAKARKSKAA